MHAGGFEHHGCEIGLARTAGKMSAGPGLVFGQLECRLAVKYPGHHSSRTQERVWSLDSPLLPVLSRLKAPLMVPKCEGVV